MSDITKTRIACNLCRRQKIRCDRAEPACENCRLAGIDCVFTPLPRRKKPREQLEENRIYTRQLEELLRERENHAFASLPSLFEPSTFQTSLAGFLWHLQYCAPGVTMNAQLASIFDFDEFARQLTSTRPPGVGDARGTNIVLPQWPTRLVVEQTIRHFIKSRLFTIFPVVDTEALTSLLEANALDPGAENINPGDRACLVAFTAFVTGMEHPELPFLGTTPDSYLQAALSMVPQLLMEHTNIRALEALLLMSLYIAPLGQPQTAELLLSMAIRILYNLGGHIIPRPFDSLSSDDRRRHEHLRSIFWMCYSVDKEMSLRKCQAPLIHDADCDLDLPATYTSSPSMHQFFRDEQGPDQPIFPSDLRLVLFKSRIYQQLYSRPTLQVPAATRLRVIRELDHELHELKSQFPPACQAESFLDTCLLDTDSRGLSIRDITIHLEYYHCLTKIHGASLVGHDVTEESSTPSSSLDLCYQAARSTLIYLSRMSDLIQEESFWIYIQYLLTAVLALHYRLVTRPDNSHPYEDISILEGTLDIFVRLNKNSSSHSFAPFIITEAFIRHLIKLSCP